MFSSKRKHVYKVYYTIKAFTKQLTKVHVYNESLPKGWDNDFMPVALVDLK